MPRVERRVTLPPARESARKARQILKEAIVEADRQQWLDNAELALSEVVTNALLHAHTEIELAVVVNGQSVCVEVRDYDKTLPVQRHYGDEATTGRGLALVAALTRECGVQSLGDGGKVVWFCVGDQDAAASPDSLIDAWALDFEDALAPLPPGQRAVRLEGLPVALWLAAREHHDALVRELCHYMAEHDDVQLDITATDRARSTISATLIGVLDSMDAAPERIDLDITVPSDGGGLFSAMQDTLDAGEALAVEGLLLVYPGLPEIVALRDWACEQVIAQLMGMQPSPWPGTAQERFETEVHDQKGESAQWDASIVNDSDKPVAAADEANRILAVSRPLADLLGWDPEKLVGRRVVTIVPPALREAHVAGFSRHLSTGQSRVLGTPVEVPVLTADGAERPCRLLIERAPVSTGRQVYLAWFEPLDLGAA